MDSSHWIRLWVKSDDLKHPRAYWISGNSMLITAQFYKSWIRPWIIVFISRSIYFNGHKKYTFTVFVTQKSTFYSKISRKSGFRFFDHRKSNEMFRMYNKVAQSHFWNKLFWMNKICSYWNQTPLSHNFSRPLVICKICTNYKAVTDLKNIETMNITKRKRLPRCNIVQCHLSRIYFYLYPNMECIFLLH